MADSGVFRGRGAYYIAALFLLGSVSAFVATVKARADDDAVTQPFPAEEPVAKNPSDDGRDAHDRQKESVTEPRSKPSAEDAKTSDAVPSAFRASTVNAVYRINWLGSHIGDFRLRSSITNKQYALQATADISVFFGSVTWKGNTTSKGLMTANGPMPQDYLFRYSTGEKREAVELRFQQRMVQDIIINPPPHPGSRNVPLTAMHLQNVVDPLSAVVLLSQGIAHKASGEGACARRLPIFDGRVRYDLVLSPKGTRRIDGIGKLRGTAYVCTVRYMPLAGHKAGRQSEGDYMTGNTGIEVWLVPVPDAGLLVPYYITIPTPAGTASMVTASFDLDTPSGKHALAD